MSSATPKPFNTVYDGPTQQIQYALPTGWTPINTVLINYTTTQKNALSPLAGTLVFDTTLGKLCVYTGSAWQTVTSA